MFFWFIACAVVLVLVVFESPAVDYRFVVAGAVLPLVESATGSPWLLHTLLGSVGLLLVVMAVTTGRGRRIVRRRWLGLPIGMFLFLVASGSWLRTELFWWPFGGDGGVGHGHPPEFDRPLAVLIVLELCGIAALGWVARRHHLTDRERWRRLAQTGRLDRPAPG